MLRPVPRSGPDRSDRALPLAGSTAIWFDTVMENRTARAASDLARDDMARLSGPRSDLCGLTLDHPRIMGILNVTPDSFSDGGDHMTVAAAVDRARQMAVDADILDIGGESTRPGARAVPVAEEIDRTAPVIAAIRAAGINTPISIDTRKARVAAAALAAGADMVNDVSSLSFDPDMAGLVADRGVPVCLMHARGTPETMQTLAQYDDVVADVITALADRIAAAEGAGVARHNIVVDPGIGFGKTLEHNLALLRHLSALHDLGLPVLLGASRKRFIGTVGGTHEARDRLPGSIAVALEAVRQGAQILRVHDPAETRQAVRLFAALQMSA